MIAGEQFGALHRRASTVADPPIHARRATGVVLRLGQDQREPRIDDITVSAIQLTR